MADFGVPPGYRFAPTDQELITMFLENKAMGMQISEVYPIIDRPLYGKHAMPWDVLTENDPWQDSDSPNKKIIYVFTRLIFVNGNTKNRVSRTAGCGTWGGKAVTQEIKNSRGQVIGQKKSFTFKPREGSEAEMNARGHWIMHEYSSVARGNQNVNLDDYVICRISKELPKGQLFDKVESQIIALSTDFIVRSSTDHNETSRKRKSSSVNYDHDIQKQGNMSYSHLFIQESDDQELFRDFCPDGRTNLTTLGGCSVNDSNQRPKEVIPFSDSTMFYDFSVNNVQQQIPRSDHANLYTFSNAAGNLQSGGFAGRR